MTDDTQDTTREIFSPCVGICCIGSDGLCIGCFRSVTELADWFTASDARKREILENCRMRQSKGVGASGSGQ